MDLCDDCQKFCGCKLREKNEEAGIIPEICPQHRSVLELSNKSLQDVHKTFLKRFPNLDTTRIDTRLAWKNSNEFGLGTPVWMFELSRSGFLKTTLTNSMLTSPKILEVNELTPKALVSGLDQKGKPVRDLGMSLTQRNRCIIVGETACLKAMNQGDQSQTFAVLKTLHDGNLNRRTGSGISKYYSGCNTSIWFNSTHDFHKQTIIHQEIGTCYLVDVIPLDMSKDEEDSYNALKNTKELEQIKKETQYVVQCYLAHHHLNMNFELTDEDKDFIVREANRLIILRTTGTYDHNNELTYIPEPEHPARVTQQLAKFYQSLMSLDEHYDRERAKKIIRRVVDGSGDPVLVDILNYLNNNCWGKNYVVKFTVTDLLKKVNVGNNTIKRRLELLFSLKYLGKEEKESGPQGGNPRGFQYFLREDVDEKKWQILFREDIEEKPEKLKLRGPLDPMSPFSPPKKKSDEKPNLNW